MKEIPIGVKAIEIALDGGGKLRFPSFESAKLGQILESRAAQALSGVKKAINLPAWSKLTFKLEEDGTLHFLYNHSIREEVIGKALRREAERTFFQNGCLTNRFLSLLKKRMKIPKR